MKKVVIQACLIVLLITGLCIYRYNEKNGFEQVSKIKIECFEDEVEKISIDIYSRLENLIVEKAVDVEKLKSMVQVILLTEKANYYKRLAEKIIDEKID